MSRQSGRTIHTTRKPFIALVLVENLETARRRPGFEMDQVFDGSDCHSIDGYDLRGCKNKT
jgi:hypothetical protein